MFQSLREHHKLRRFIPISMKPRNIWAFLLKLSTKRLIYRTLSAIGHTNNFLAKKILAATLSSHLVPAPLLSRSSIFDTRSTVNSSQLVNTIRFIAESLCKQVYSLGGQHSNHPNTNIIAQSQGVNSHFVDAWLEFIGRQARSIGHVNKQSEIIIQVERLFNSVLTDAKKISFPLDVGYKFYTSTTEQMSAFRVKPISFDLMLSVCIVFYLCILHVAIQAPTSIEQFKQIFTLKS